MNPDNIFSVQGQEIRGRAQKLTGKRQQQYIDGRLGLVIDGTGKNIEKVKGQAKKLKDIGYDVAMILVNTDIETALERNRQRDRSLPDAEVQKYWKKRPART